VGTLPYVLSITRKEMKINFLQVLDIRMPSGQGVTPKTTHWRKPRQAYLRENASLGWQYLTLTCDIIVISGCPWPKATVKSAVGARDFRPV
jgi:hypothetical protein